MLTRIFGQINSATSILIGLFAILVLVAQFSVLPTPVFTLTTAWTPILYVPIAGYIIFGAGTLILVFGLQWLIEFKYKLFKRHAFYPFFILVFTLVFSLQTNLDLLVGLLFFVLIFRSWLSIYQGEKLLGRTLNTGLLIGFGSLLDTSISIMLPLSFVAFTIFGRLNGRTFLILLVGYVTIWINALALEYIVLSTNTTYGLFLQMFQFEAPKLQITLSKNHLFFLGFFLLLSLTEVANTLNRASVFKRQVTTLMLFLIGVITLLFFISGSAVFYVAILIPSVAFLFVNYFQFVNRNWVKEIILILSLAALALFDTQIL